jgi:tetratricopeptide (TPR) repeat protein
MVSTRHALAAVLLVMALLMVATSFLARAHRTERARRAERRYTRGLELATQGRHQEAAGEYRAALSYAPAATSYRLALASELMALGRLDEAEAHLTELRETDPTSARVNLMLARIAARQDRTEDAVLYYHRAIYGLWDRDPERNRLQTRFELVEFLGEAGERKLGLADLLELAEDAPDDPEVRVRIGRLLLAFGSPYHAGEIFRAVLEMNPRDAAAYTGLGEAEFAAGRYSAARAAFSRALLRDPKDEAAARRLRQATRILELDPTLPRLSSTQRRRRSLELMRESLDALERCESSPAALRDELSAAAARLLKARRRTESDMDDALALAHRAWTARRRYCPKAEADQALEIVMEGVAQ